MKNNKNINTDEQLKLVLQELKENPFQKFNLTFCLMSVIPFLVFFYLLASKLLTLNVLIGHTGVVLFISIFIALCGFCLGYSVIRDILNKVVFYATKAKHSDQLKSIFVASVSHELKNPLAIIKINLFNILASLIGHMNEEQKRLIELCDKIVERMKRLINDLLDLHKIEAGVVDVKRKLCNFTEIIERQSAEFEIMFRKKRIKFIKEVLAKDLSIWGDKDKIVQVVNNLLDNAVKYTPEEGNIYLKIYSVDGLARLEITNTGEVIPVDRLEKIFDKFERIDETKEGTGLGLAIAKDIVELHKGKIWAESQPDKGNRFVVVLPCDLRRTPR